MAAKYSRPAYRLALIILATACAFVALHVAAQFGVDPPANLFRRAGKSIGKLAGLLSAGALAYYLLREAFVRLLVKKPDAPWAPAGPYVKAGVTILRLFHPAMGVAVLALAIAHGYIMWLAWGGFAGGWPVVSGIILAGGGAMLAAGGLWLHKFSRGLVVRRSHRLAAFLAVVLFMVHKIIAD